MIATEQKWTLKRKDLNNMEFYEREFYQRKFEHTFRFISDDILVKRIIEDLRKWYKDIVVEQRFTQLVIITTTSEHLDREIHNHIICRYGEYFA